MRLLAATLLVILLAARIASAETITRMPLFVNDLVYSPLTGRLYASLPGSSGPDGNSILAIDPAAAKIVASDFVGSEPGRLALSDDGQFLYVGLDGAGAVRRIHLPSRTLGPQFSLGNSPTSGPQLVADLKVLPGRPESVAVARRVAGFSSDVFTGIALFDNGIMRPDSVTPLPSSEGISRIVFGASPSRLYALSPLRLTRFSAAAGRPAQVGVPWTLASRSETEFAFAGGLIYLNSGAMLDPESGTRVGTFPGVQGPALVLPDLAHGRVFFLLTPESNFRGGPQTRTLLAFATDSFRLLGAVAIPNLEGRASSLVRWGEDGIAFRVDSGVILIRTPLVSGSTPPRSGITVFRPQTREWFLREADGTASVVAFGGPGDVPVPADYLGYGSAQVAVFRPATRQWFVRDRDGKTIPILIPEPSRGAMGDAIPVPADFTGTGRMQASLFWPALGEWNLWEYERQQGANVPFGGSTDLPVPADYLGAGRAQVAVFRPKTGEWFIRSADGGVIVIPWGAPGDRPVPGDYLGRRFAQLALYRPSTGEWLIRSEDGRPIMVPFLGGGDDVPLPGDYGGVGRTQIAVFRPATREWFVRNDSGAATRIPWGGPGDLPISAGFAPHFGSEP